MSDRHVSVLGKRVSKETLVVGVIAFVCLALLGVTPPPYGEYIAFAAITGYVLHGVRTMAARASRRREKRR